MTLSATVLVPTHVHGPTLYHSVGSALAQTVSDIEVIIVGDGADETTREVATDLQRRDPRVRYLDFPKGPRVGEIHRHTGLEKARGRIVCYLSDDDIWLPNHVEVMDSLLQGGVVIAHTLPVRFEADGSYKVGSVDLALPYYREGILAGRNWIPLSCGGHTLEAYRRLPEGWATTPRKVLAADLHMWQKLLQSKQPAMSGTRPTVLVFPSPFRPGWPVERRAEELSDWARRVSTAEGRAAFVDEILDYTVRERARINTLTPRGRVIGLIARLGLFPTIYRLRMAAKGVFARGAR